MKILQGATIDMPAHFAFYVKICNKIPNDYHQNKKIQAFCIIACPRGIEISKSS